MASNRLFTEVDLSAPVGKRLPDPLLVEHVNFNQSHALGGAGIVRDRGARPRVPMSQ
jgi:hypothetical protein